MTIEFTTAREVPADVEVLGVAVFAGEPPLSTFAEVDAGYLDARGFKGNVGDVIAMPADDGSVVVALGLGPRQDLDAEALRRAGGAFARNVGTARRAAIGIHGVAPDVIPPARAAQAVVEGVRLGAYKYQELRSEQTPNTLESVVLVGSAGKPVEAASARGARIAEAACLARDLANAPANVVTPERMAEVAREIAEREGLEVEVLEEQALLDGGFGGIIGVSQGSDQPPRLIRLTWAPERARGHVVLVGKAITFDSGGYSLKTAEGMMAMKTDMSGGAAVLAAMSVVRDVAPRLKVTGIVCATENLVNGSATKPGDVHRMRNGTTVEILNTDAEGRLVLADGLSLAVELAPDAIFDIATLTGAQVIALGKGLGAVLGNDEGIIDQVRAAGDRAGEPFWPLPLPDVYRWQIESEVADIKNIGQPMHAGTIVGGMFLKEFVGDVPWAHLDIAGPSRAAAADVWLWRDGTYVNPGATGFGARTLLEIVAGFEKPRRAKT